MEITHLLVVSDLARSRAFYRDVLGAEIYREYGGSSITEPELEAAFQRGLPTQSRACRTELGEFFTEWFDTAYPTASGAMEPDITGPGLDGSGFSCKNA